MWNEMRKMNLEVGMPRLARGNTNRYNKGAKRQKGNFGLKKKLFQKSFFFPSWILVRSFFLK
jgi:hypothetical protein